MVFSLLLASTVALQPLDLPANAHDLRLQRGEFPVVAGLQLGEEAGQLLGLGEGIGGFREPHFLV